MRGTAFALLVVAGTATTVADQAPRKPPARVNCDMNDAVALKKYENAVAADPVSVPAMIALAQCHDTAWRFADAERVIREILATVRHQAAQKASVVPPPGAIPMAGGRIRVPAVTVHAQMDYPVAAADRGITGTVAIEVRLDRRGRVSRTRVIEGDEWLRRESEVAIRKIRFEPPQVNGSVAEIDMVYFAEFGQPADLMPADWLDRARVFLSMGAAEPAVVPLEAALARATRDRARFGDSGEFDRTPPAVKPPPPTKLRHTAPAYPQVALARHITGEVVVEALVDKFGEIGRTRVTKSSPVLDAAAVDAVRTWTYTPVTEKGEPVTFILTVTVTFTL